MGELVDGVNVTTLAFGPASLDRDDGAKFSVKLIESDRPNDPIEYIQLVVPSNRLSKILEYGGTIIRGYGWTNVKAPGNFSLFVQVADRRDPFQFIAIRVSNMDKAVKHYKAQGMTASKPWRKKTIRKDLSINMNTIWAGEDVYTPS